MGSSHFINSCGSLWGIERNSSTDRTDFLGGAQRLTGQQSIATLVKDDDDWFQIVPDVFENLELALNTAKRREAWQLIPDDSFTYLEAVDSVKPVMAESTFHDWWKHSLTRLGLVVPAEGSRYVKTSSSAQV